MEKSSQELLQADIVLQPEPTGMLITNRQRCLTLSSLGEGLKEKVTGSKMSIPSDDSLYAAGIDR